MTESEFLRMMRSFVARAAVAASAVRGRGNAGTVRNARRFLREVDLTVFATSDPSLFAQALNDATERLRQVLPKDAQHWGIARKVMNLYLRDCLYNHYLREAFRLNQAEGLLEVPLDSYTATALRKLEHAPLEQWRGVKHLDAVTNVAFQEVAATEAMAQGIVRVHLDALWWSLERDE